MHNLLFILFLMITLYLIYNLFKFNGFLFIFRAKIDRENQDLTLEQIKLKAAEDRVTVLESIK